MKNKLWPQGLTGIIISDIYKKLVLVAIFIKKYILKFKFIIASCFTKYY